MTLSALAQSTSEQDVRMFKVMAVDYKTVGGNPIVQLICRDRNSKQVYVQVNGHSPSLYVSKDEWDDSMLSHPSVQYAFNDGRTDVHGNELIRVMASTPSSVNDLRDYFNTTYEADASNKQTYHRRFLIDTQIGTTFKLDTSDSSVDTESQYCDIQCDVTDIEPVDNELDVRPKMLTVDIEVASESGFPEPTEADAPISTIVAHDNYSDKYVGFMLAYDSWEDTFNTLDDVIDKIEKEVLETTPLDSVEIFDEENDMLNEFNNYVADIRPDLFSGWYSDSFDYPYLINRCKTLGVWSFKQWSPLDEVYISSGWNQPVIKGATMFDMLKGYEKTQYQKLPSKKLEAIAKKELGVGKEQFTAEMELGEDDNEYTWMWHNKPIEFMQYNYRDVEAVIEIEDAKGIIDLFDNLRSVTGAVYNDCHNNIDLIDMLMLREAHQRGMVLPTSEEPTRGWYYGAYVFTPKAGLHEHVVYPDLASLYPNMIAQCNMSPETLVGTQSELEASQWTEDDCVWSYIDTRKDNLKKDSSPEYERIYFLKPSIKEGFVASLVDDLISAKNEYKGTDLYMAVKAVVNSLYGVLGDSNSFGKGFRLFDWRIAEATTLGGRKVIQWSAEQFTNYAQEMGAENSYVCGGDTDSVMTALDVSSQEEAVNMAIHIAELVNADYEEYVADTFNADSRMEIEVESYSPRLFYPQKDKAPHGVGVKKRYSSTVTWEEGEELDGELNIKGFEYVRSDVAQATIDVQGRLFKLITDSTIPLGDAHDEFRDYITQVIEDVRNGDVEIEWLGTPVGIGQHLSEYGSPNRRPQPKYRGAKYANQHIYEADAIGEGDKPLYYPVERVVGDMPKTFSTDTAEDGDYVDSIAVLDVEDIPSEIVLDTEEIIEKVFRTRLNPILHTLNWDFDDMLSDSQQIGLEDFM